MSKRIVFLMSDTGGGHRAAAVAINEALNRHYGDRADFETEIVDVFRHCAYPLNRQPEWYAWMVRHARWLWSLIYHAGNGKHRAPLFASSMYWQNHKRLKAMAQQHPADVIVSVHSVVTRPAMSAYNALEQTPPMVVVVTDLVSTPVFWYDTRARRCLVPTQTAYERGIKFGMTPDQLRVTGLPVHPEFTDKLMAKADARAQLGWSPDKPVILMMSGGDGMGPLYETARAIDALRLDCQLAIITGKNEKLRHRLSAATWNTPPCIYGFRRDIPRLMAAADILVTKAGPATISEAAIAGLPMIISDKIPGQEAGNVEYVIQNDAGVYAPDPAKVARTVADWLAEGADGLKKRSDNARRIAHPDAVHTIADEIWQVMTQTT